MARPRPRFRRRAGGGGAAGASPLPTVSGFRLAFSCSGLAFSSSVTWLGPGAGTAGGGSVGVFFRRVGSRAAGDSGRAVRAGSSPPLPTSGTRLGTGADRPAGGADIWACALSSAARMRCRSEADSSGFVNGPVPGPRFVPGTRRGRGEPPLSSATPTPWLRARRRNRSPTEQHKTVCQSTQTGQLTTDKTWCY
jgi:hypothetical protein